MERVDYKPLGSLIRVKGTTQKFVIIARGVNLNINEKNYFFDYGCILYPDGFDGKDLAYVNDKDITEVVQLGYSDSDDNYICEQINTKIGNDNILHSTAVNFVRDVKE